MSLPGGVLNGPANGGNLHYHLTSPNSTRVYLNAKGNAALDNTAGTYVCNRCHHGLGTIDYQKDQQGTSHASVLWGDSTLTCISCHDTHDVQSGKNVRAPQYLVFHNDFITAANPNGGLNKFLDGTAIPTDPNITPNPVTGQSKLGTDTICAFCHQGRESGLTQYKAMLGVVDPYGNNGANWTTQNAKLTSVADAHHVPDAAFLWSKNAWEFAGKSYTNGNEAHQAQNCSGCHMPTSDDPTGATGGHTFTPGVATCQKCHGADITDFDSIPAGDDYNGDGKVGTIGEELVTGDPTIPGSTGLIQQLVNALAANGIQYTGGFPAFVVPSGGLSPAQLAAAYNLNMIENAPHSYIHNYDYVVQLLQDSIQAAGGTVIGVRPGGERPATDYTKFDWTNMEYAQ